MKGNDLIIVTTLINDILAFQNNVLLATDSGIYFSSDYGENFDYSHSAISATKVYKFEKVENNIFAGTDNGVFLLGGDTWNDFVLSGEDIYSLKFFSGFLFCGTDDKIFVLKNGKVENEFSGTGRVQAFSIFRGKLLVGTSRGLFEAGVSDLYSIFSEPVLSLDSSSEKLFAGLHSGVSFTGNLKDFERIPLQNEIIRAVLSAEFGGVNYVLAGSDSGLWVSDTGGEPLTEKNSKMCIFLLFLRLQLPEKYLWDRGEEAL